MSNERDTQKETLTLRAAKNAPPLLSIVGNSGSGKTTFIEKLIPELIRRGLRVGSLKHDVHGFEMDKPGKDTWRHKQAGASTTIISSPAQIGMVMDVSHDHNPQELLPFFQGVDIVLAEGYKRGNWPKIEIFRTEVTSEPLCADDGHLLAMITDTDLAVRVPRFSTTDARGVATFLIDRFELAPGLEPGRRKSAS